MELPIWRENPEQISGKKRRAAAKLGGKPGLDFWQKLEWILPVGGKTRTGFLGQKLEWILPVGGKTRTGFLRKTGMDSPGWRENPDWISRKTGMDSPVGGKTRTGLENWNGFSRLEGKPGLDFSGKLEWILPVGGKTPDLEGKTGMDSPGWRENPDWISLENWNGFSRFWNGPIFWKTGMGHPVGGKTASLLGWKVYSYGVQSPKARLF
ncbi:hypothetical protein DUI87_17223 [Hirundo rustica rustica]|uniref:Uncharacterized protein n=1 Tax=Hirundo rustica rustica TaxID=333673 RepID=A0A3M0K3I7_HIRRU|nr:hypothetical protein DUI87_17223 [Hirundo rustica rustica]